MFFEDCSMKKRLSLMTVTLILVITTICFTFLGCNDTDSSPSNSSDSSTSSEDKTYNTVDDLTIHFGTYPQSEVTDSKLKSQLRKLAGTLPTSSASRRWTSYGYYIDGSVTNFMWYIDIEKDNEKYRGVYFTSYRPHFTETTYSSSEDNYYPSYYTNTVYWFKYEPIKWQILNAYDGKIFLLADMAIDSQNYYISTSSREIDGETVYPNNYEYSAIRTWLNDTFYNTAFDDSQKKKILTTTVDNSVTSAGNSNKSYACADTSDKVFLLSHKEAKKYLMSDTQWGTRWQRQSTDYAKSQGCWASTSSSYSGNCWWWLRSPRDYSIYLARSIHYDGNVDYYSYVPNTQIGVVPALWMDIF